MIGRNGRGGATAPPDINAETIASATLAVMLLPSDNRECADFWVECARECREAGDR